MSELSEIDKQERKEKVDRYKVLFDFYKSEYDSLRNEYYKVEDKASKYLTFLSVLSGAFLLLFKDSIERVELNPLNILMLFLLTLLVITLSTSWRFIFMSIATIELKNIPFNNENIEYFDKNYLDVFYYSMAKQYVEVIDSYKSAIKIKTDFLSKAFSEVKITGLILLILLCVKFAVKVST